jgi:predicted HTH transcriptional regulator
MKKFWLYFFLFLSIWLVMTWITTNREKKETSSQMNESFTTDTNNDPKLDTYNVDQFPDYHDTEEEIRDKNDIPVHTIKIKNKNGSVVSIPREKTQNTPVYYSIGSFQYSPSTYVPNYEDTISLSQTSLKRQYTEPE